MGSLMSNLFGGGIANLVSAFALLLVVAAVIYGLAKISRLIRGNSFVVGKKLQTPRLAVCDAAAIDHTRRLVLVRRDNVEHLILIGGTTDLVIESSIAASRATSVSESKLPSDSATTMGARADIQKAEIINNYPLPRQPREQYFTDSRTIDQSNTNNLHRSNTTDGDLSNVAPIDPSVRGAQHERARFNTEANISRLDPSIKFDDEQATSEISFEDIFEAGLTKKPR